MEPRVPLLRRLALLKSMFREAQDECRRPSPWNATAVLHLHDVVELFLSLACDHHGKRIDHSFMEYFNVLRGVADLRREGMERLNRARVDFKHYGNLPHDEDLDFFRFAVETFLEDATPKLFGGMKFAEISLIEVIACETAKAHLAAAQVRWEAQRHREATESLASGGYHSTLGPTYPSRVARSARFQIRSSDDSWKRSSKGRSGQDRRSPRSSSGSTTRSLSSSTC